MTEKDGKATGWKAWYRNGKWEEEQSRRASRPRRKS